MSKSNKRKQREIEAAIINRLAQQAANAKNEPEPSNSLWNRITSVPKVIYAAITAVVTIAGLSGFYIFFPKFEISMAEMIRDPRQPFSKTFEIKNASIYPVYNAKVSIFAYKMKSPIGDFSGLYASIGSPADYTRFNDGETITGSFEPNIIGTVSAADMGVELKYTLPGAWWTNTKLFRLVLKTNVAGTFNWVKQPADTEFEKALERTKSDRSRTGQPPHPINRKPS